MPTLIASCPTGAIRPATVDGKPSVEVIEEQCMFCGNCYTVCPAMPMNDAEHDGLSIWVGGKVSNARSAPKFSKLAIPFLPNNPPRWPEVVDAVVKIVDVYAANARKYERVGEWIERIGWPRFFQLTGFEFTRYHIDDFKHAGLTYARSAHDPVLTRRRPGRRVGPWGYSRKSRSRSSSGATAGAGDISPLRPAYVAKTPPCTDQLSHGNRCRDWLVGIAQHQAYGRTPRAGIRTGVAQDHRSAIRFPRSAAAFASIPASWLQPQGEGRRGRHPPDRALPGRLRDRARIASSPS